MNFKNLAIAVLVVQGLTHGAYAQNRNGTDTLFNEPAKAGGTQLLLGIVELIGSSVLFSSASTPAKQLVSAAETNLAHAKSLPLNRHDYQVLVSELSNGWSGIRSTTIVNNEEELLRILKDNGGPFTASEKASKIASAEKALVDARAMLMSEIALTSKGQKVIAGIKVVGGSVLVIDVIGRIYIWNSLDADPGFSPTVRYLQNLISK